MKKFAYLCSVICFTLGLFACAQPTNSSDEKVTELQQKVKELEKLVNLKDSGNPTHEQVSLHQGPSRTALKQVESYVFGFSYEQYDSKSHYEVTGLCHCFLYAHKDDYSFIALPRHCFKYDENKIYALKLTDEHGKESPLNWSSISYSDDMDAEVIQVSKLDYISNFSQNGNMDQSYVPGDSVSLLTMFGSRNVYQKKGVLVSNGAVKSISFYTEPGDSGSLVVGNNGVLGVFFGTSSNDEQSLHFVPISYFEDLYYYLAFPKKSH